MWDTPFTASLATTANAIIHRVSTVSGPLSAHTILLVHLLVKQGDLGFRAPHHAAMHSFSISALRSAIRYDTAGLDIRAAVASHSSTVHLPAVYAQPLAYWQSTGSPSRFIQVFRHYLPAYLLLIRDVLDAPDLTRPSLLQDTPLPGLPAKLYTHSFDSAYASLLPSLDQDFVSLLPAL
jgi:hypothetical protein